MRLSTPCKYLLSLSQVNQHISQSHGLVYMPKTFRIQKTSDLSLGWLVHVDLTTFFHLKGIQVKLLGL